MHIRCVRHRDFNPLPRKEGDRCGLQVSFVRKISIHSLVKRETVRASKGQAKGNNFNPLPRKEGDSFHLFIIHSDINFNPLPRKEGDAAPWAFMMPSVISIHSLVKRETWKYSLYPAMSNISIHSLVKRETG